MQVSNSKTNLVYRTSKQPFMKRLITLPSNVSVEEAHDIVRTQCKDLVQANKRMQITYGYDIETEHETYTKYQSRRIGDPGELILPDYDDTYAASEEKYENISVNAMQIRYI